MWSKLQEKGKQLPGGHFKWVKGTRVSKWVNVGENPQLIWLTGLLIMLAQWWQWSAQATAQTTGLLWFKFCSMCKPLEWICSLTKIRTATYAKTYPGAVYTAIEVGIIFCKEFQNDNQIIKGDYPPTLCEKQARPSGHRPGECGWVHNRVC